MILQLLFSIIFFVLSGFTFFLPSGEKLPFGIDAVFVNISQTTYGFMELIPPLGIIVNGIIVYVGFKIALIVLKLFIGHRAPTA